MLAASGFKTTEKIVSESIYWQRVDPRTVFEQSLFNSNPAADYTQALILKLQTEPLEKNRLGTSEIAINNRFLPWIVWNKITEVE